MGVVAFPGQGVQRVGMGADLFGEFPDAVSLASEVLGFSFRELCEAGPADRLTATENAQPAIYVVNALAYRRWRAANPEPAYFLGHSVAEYNALEAAGVLSFEAGLRLVAARGEAMARAGGGAMAAVIGLDAAGVAAVLADPALAGVYAANFNTPRQVVISGDPGAVAAAGPRMLDAGASRVVPLRVSAAFHSPRMAGAREAFAAAIGPDAFRRAGGGEPGEGDPARVISNVTARPHVAAELRARMIEQITAPVRFSESIRYLLARGFEPAEFAEVGPGRGGVVKPMVVRTAREAGPLTEAELAVSAGPRSPGPLPPAPPEPGSQPAPRPPLDPPASGAPAPESSVPTSSAATAPPPPPAGPAAPELGSAAFRERFGVRRNIVAGGMYRAIASVDLVVAMAEAGLLGFFGVGGLPAAEVAAAVDEIQARVPPGAPYGVNFLSHPARPEVEEELTDVLLRAGVTTVEASSFMEVTPALARYRAKGLTRDARGAVVARHRILAKVSRPDVAIHFFRPAPAPLIAKLRAAGAIDDEEARALAEVPMADAVCVEADSGGHTDRGQPLALLPSVRALRARLAASAADAAAGAVAVGAAGGIGTPEAAAAAFVLGAEFVLLGSVNQCTVEAGTSELVKDMLEGIDVQDTAYAPSGALFELGATIQVLRKGVFFPARANKLLQLYRQHDSLEDLDDATRRQVEERFLRAPFDEVYEAARARAGTEARARAARSGKARMAMVFKRYFRDTTRWALAGDAARRVDFQVHCGPALGAFNQWARGGPFEAWRGRRVAAVAEALLDETADLLRGRLGALTAGPAGA